MALSAVRVDFARQMVGLGVGTKPEAEQAWEEAVLDEADRIRNRRKGFEVNL